MCLTNLVGMLFDMVDIKWLYQLFQAGSTEMVESASSVCSFRIEFAESKLALW